MGHGLTIFKETDHSFKKAYIYRILFSAAFTGAWYGFAKTARLFANPSVLGKSLPFVFALGLYYSKGFALQLSAAEVACDHAAHERKERYLDYKNELRNKKLID